MRIFVHYEAYGDAGKVGDLVSKHQSRILEQVNAREEDDAGVITAEYEQYGDRLAACEVELAKAQTDVLAASTQTKMRAAERSVARLGSQRDRLILKLAERDERINEARRRAAGDRRDVLAVAEELAGIYSNEDELIKHARMVPLSEIRDNEYNLNVPRYIDTFEPAPRLAVSETMKELQAAEAQLQRATNDLQQLLTEAGYEAN